MPSPYGAHKADSFVKGTAGVVLLVFGVLTQTSTPLSFLMILFGSLLAARSYTRLIRIVAREQQLGFGEPPGAAFGRGSRYRHTSASLPRQVFWLLFAVAESDGRPEQEEREMVRRFLLERFIDPVTHQDLRSWEAERIPPEQVGGLALHLRRMLQPAECETIFYWACLVAFADGSFRKDEHAVLQDVSRGLGLEPNQARAVFHHAKARILGGGDPTGSKTWGRREAGGDSSRSASGRRPAYTPRIEALALLGLEGEPSNDEEIRSRHRELVKRYHPDAHAHLGEVAAEEAERRFREVQRAYEFLTQ